MATSTAGDAGETVQNVVRSSLERAVRYYEEHLEPDDKLATDYYYARPFGDEQDGRSKVVSSDVRDATQGQLPSLLRIFFGPEHAVEFRARGPEDEAVARQQTEYVNFVIREDNDGFLAFHAAFKDALVRRRGIFKWWWDETSRVEASDYSGLDEQQVYALLSDESTKDFDVTAVRPQEDGVDLVDVRVMRRQVTGTARFAAVPPEELVWTPEARSLESAPMVAHVRDARAEELVHLGVDAETIESARGKHRSLGGDELRDARLIHGGDGMWGDKGDDLDPSQQPVLYAEAYALVDADGDGVAELRLFRCVGPQYEIVNGDGLGEIVDELPFALLTPEPEPHTILGMSNYDLLRDVQRVKSQVLRGTLDSLAQAIEPKTEVVANEVNIADLVNPEINGIVRVNRPGMMREISHAFVGSATLPMLDYYDQIKENRTGQSKASQGLDADSLQSATKAAVTATLTAAQQRVEMIARVFAETGVKSLFRGLLRLIVRHQDRERVIRLRNQYVRVDPRQWDATMDVQVNVALGQGTTEEKIGLLAGVLGMQKELMVAGSPLVTNVEIRNTLARAVELAGFRNSDEFFRPWGPEEEAAAQKAAAEQPPPVDPNMAMVEVEKAKAGAAAHAAEARLLLDAVKLQRDHAIAEDRLALEAEKVATADDTEREKIRSDTASKAAEVDRTAAIALERAQLEQETQRIRIQMETDVQRERVEGELAISRIRAENEAFFKHQQIEIDRERVDLERQRVEIEKTDKALSRKAAAARTREVAKARGPVE